MKKYEQLYTFEGTIIGDHTEYHEAVKQITRYPLDDIVESMEEFCPVCNEYTEDCKGHTEDRFNDHCPGCGAGLWQRCECKLIEQYENERR